MVQFTEQACDWEECMDKIRTHYGENFTILGHKTIRLGGIFGLFTREGIEITGYVSNFYEKTYSVGTGSRPLSSTGLSGLVTGSPVTGSPATGSPATGTSTALSSGVSHKTVPPDAPRRGPSLQNEPLDFEESKRRVLAAAGKDLTMQQVLSTVQEIKDKINQTVPESQEEHPNLKRLRDNLILNDFSPGYQDTILARIKKECSLETLEDFQALQDAALEMIGESISIFEEKPPPRLPRIMVLVGPTGAGKTTTIAKLAALYALPELGIRPLSVRMITIDSLRIGARTQIETYGNIMSIPVAYVNSQQDLRRVIALCGEDVDLVLIDTFGKSPRDAAKLGEMKYILDACGSRAETHLVLTAATKTSDLSNTMRQFEPFAYRSVIITKLDETVKVGNVISALAEKGKSVSYITDGQTVPTDIQKATVVDLLLNLDGFQINRQKVESRFPAGEQKSLDGGCNTWKIRQND
ncbi:MAG: flagellar biosynthesis protein FlhF [Treponema sp.]|jgi:flagellar biosynthesis protein FlhF|nr:flagellar biosynthesis protein FlhF [Treponema sp.]